MLNRYNDEAPKIIWDMYKNHQYSNNYNQLFIYSDEQNNTNEEFEDVDFDDVDLDNDHSNNNNMENTQIFRQTMSVVLFELSSAINQQTNSWTDYTLNMIDTELLTSKFSNLWEYILIFEMLPELNSFLLKKAVDSSLFNLHQNAYLKKIRTLMVSLYVIKMNTYFNFINQ